MNELTASYKELITHHRKHHEEEDQTIAKLRADLEIAREVVGKALEWLVDFTENHEDDSAHEQYLNLRKWYEENSKV